MRLHHVALRVADLDRAAAFYSGLLGLSEARRLADEAGRPRAIWLEADGVLLMLELRLRGEGALSGSAHLLSFAVDELGPWEARLGAAHVPVMDRTPHTLYVSDPDGHRIGLTSYRG